MTYAVIFWSILIGHLLTTILATTSSLMHIDPLAILQNPREMPESSKGLGTAERLFDAYKRRREDKGNDASDPTRRR